MNEKKPVEGEVVDAEFVDEKSLARQVHGELRVSREPELVLQEAHKAAKALQEVIEQKKNKVVLNGKTYLQFEDWQTVGRFYGVSVKVVSTNFVQFGEAQGFEARAEVILISNGLSISAADSMCLNDEDKWSKRPKYEWRDKLDGQGNKIWKKGEDGKSRPDRERVQVGEEHTPLFQLRSMAQTRACAKALRNVLAFVPVLAGYAPTPAEEMEGVVSLTEAVEEGRRQGEEEAKFKEREREQKEREKIQAEQPKRAPINAPAPSTNTRQAKEIKAAIREKVERDPAIVTVSGMIDSVTEGRYSDKTRADTFRKVTLSLPGGKPMHMSAFDNKKFPDNTHFFDILEMAVGMHASFVIKTKGRYIDIIRPVKIATVEFDEEGIPIIQRKEGYVATDDDLPEILFPDSEDVGQEEVSDDPGSPPLLMAIGEALYSSRSGEWATPQGFFDALDQEFHFDLDAAATPENTKCKAYLTDALSDFTRWEKYGNVIWCNPPYGKEIGKWFAKAREAAAAGATVVMLAHARTDTIWWHTHVQGIASEVRFVKGRLKFVGPGGVKSSAPFPSAVIIYKPRRP